MSKDPAFLFYPNDYLGGTMGFSIEQHGLYILALIFQFNAGRFTEQQINGILNNRFNEIKHKFKTDGILYWNERLDTEKEKRSKYVESRQNNGRAFLLKKDKLLINTKIDIKHMGLQSIPHMENENEDRNRDVNSLNSSLKSPEKLSLKIPDHLVEIWPDFLAMRRAIRKPATERAQRNLFRDLEKFYPGDTNLQIISVEQSITNAWQGVFKIREDFRGKEKQPYDREARRKEMESWNYGEKTV